MSAYSSDVNAWFLLLPSDLVVKVALHKMKKMGIYFRFKKTSYSVDFLKKNIQDLLQPYFLTF